MIGKNARQWGAGAKEFFFIPRPAASISARCGCSSVWPIPSLAPEAAGHPHLVMYAVLLFTGTYGRGANRTSGCSTRLSLLRSCVPACLPGF